MIISLHYLALLAHMRLNFPKNLVNCPTLSNNSFSLSPAIRRQRMSLNVLQSGFSNAVDTMYDRKTSMIA